MQTIWKYSLAYNRSAKMPEGAVILSVQIQKDEIVLWALVNPENEKVWRRFEVFGTGHSIDTPVTSRDFIGTVQDESLVWHIFEVS